MTKYALIEAGVIVEVDRDPRRHNGLWTYATDAELADPAWPENAPEVWLLVVENARPPDTPTTRFIRGTDPSSDVNGYALITGVPTQVWTEVPKTQQEIDDEAAEADRLARRAAALLEDLPTMIDDAAADRLAAVEIRDRTINNNAQRDQAISDLGELMRLSFILHRQTLIVVYGLITDLEE